MRRTALLMGLWLAATASMALAADWPRFAGPKANWQSLETGINKDWAARPPAELWRVALTDEGYAGPSVAEGRVFVIDHQAAEDVVRALNANTGEEMWAFHYADPGGANYGFARSTPTWDKGLLYTLGRRGQVFCLKADTGEQVWQRNLIDEFGGKIPQWNYSASPVVDGDRLIVAPGGPNANVVALNKLTGETVWAGGGTFEMAGYATPVIATINEVKQYLVHTGDALTGVRTEDGALLWQIPWKTSYGVNASMPLVEGNYVFITSGYNMGCAVYQITADGPQQVWASKAISAQFSSPILYNGYVFSTTDPGALVCLAPNDGTELWRQAGFEKGGAIIVDGVIIAVAGATGAIIMAEASPAGYKELGRLPGLGGQSWTAPIIANGKLYVRNKTAIACYDLSQ